MPQKSLLTDFDVFSHLVQLATGLQMSGSLSGKTLVFFRLGLLGSVLLSNNSLSGQTEQEGASTEELQKATQNPVASLISVPFQNNSDFNIGPFARDNNTLNIQPVVPTKLNEKWNLIPRIIIPLIFKSDISQPHLGTFGLGDIQPTFFFAPTKPSRLIWGIGPALLLPTATDDTLGTGKWSIGPALVALVQPNGWTIGILVNNLWSFAGSSPRPDVNSMSLQYFINHNMKKGWYLTSSPIISANWNASANNVWLIPLGGGVGRIFKMGVQPVNGSLSAYYNVVRPDALPSPTWQLRVQLALLFPRIPKKSD
ncbi:MAG TPA: neuromedin U [Candidatus Binatia bacterium]|nr:neuromedin U [Candidatus Binatia bacterium]